MTGFEDTDFKILLHTFKALNGLAPSYIPTLLLHILYHVLNVLLILFFLTVPQLNK